MKIKQTTTWKWTKWFAWFPIKDDNTGKILWLETVERKLQSANIPNVYPSTWTIYREQHTHNPSKISGICKDCGEQLMPEEVNL